MSPDNDLEREISQLEQRYAENAHGLVFAHLADAYRRAGEYSKAEGLLLHGLKTHPSYTSAYNVLGRVYVESERYADAQAQFARVLELDPQNLISLRALGDLAARRGFVEDARVWYERMLQVDPRSEEAREGLARLTTAHGGPAAPEPVEAEALTDAPEPEPYPVEEPDLEPEASVYEAVPVEVVSAPEEPPTLGLAEPDLETVEKVEAEIEPVEGLIADEEMRGFALESIAADTAETSPYSEEPFAEELFAEPWALEDVHDLAEADFAAPGVVPEAEGDEPWGAAEPEPWEEASVEPEAEAVADEGAEPSPVDEMGSLELPSMDDWSPGFVVGELLEGRAIEDLRPEEILEGLDAEISFDAVEESTGEKDVAGGEGVERRGEAVVTETMAELYASQGLYSDALAVYRQLAEARPDDERLEARILDLERRVEEAGFFADAEEEELARLMRLTEPAEEESAEAIPVEETAPEPEADVFEFEDEAPVAGFEQLDPFAASFDALAARTHPVESFLAEETPPAAGPTAEQPEETEPAAAEFAQPTAAEPEPVPVESLAEEPVAEELPASIENIEGDFAPFDTLAEQSAAEVVAEEVTEVIGYSPAEEGITAVDSIWELTDVGASIGRETATDHEVAEADEESDVPVRFVTGAGRAEHREPSTMEDYLGALLACDVESLLKKNANSAEPPADDEPLPSPESSNAEDLEQFQEWLRSLKR